MPDMATLNEGSKPRSKRSRINLVTLILNPINDANNSQARIYANKNQEIYFYRLQKLLLERYEE
jgi:hypothetical protein